MQEDRRAVKATHDMPGERQHFTWGGPADRREAELNKQDWECTSFFEGDWIDCCVMHDLYCVFAKLEKSEKIRKFGDRELKKCVCGKGRLIHRIIGNLMYAGVRGYILTKKLTGKPGY